MHSVTTEHDEYITPFKTPPRFRLIDQLNKQEQNRYSQIRNRDKIASFRKKLLGLVDADLRLELDKLFEEWANYGLSICEIDTTQHHHFKLFYDGIMEKYAVKKEAYNKVDFAAQKITHLITDKRCLTEKLSIFQIFKAAYQLGTEPAVSNFRFMYNSADKADGKYREWMFHFDNSNYAAEYKLITTRLAGTSLSNSEQCLAAFPYDTEKAIRFTESEAATKFSTMAELEREFCGIAGAAYAVIKNEVNGAPLETGIRTEMLLHHRSATATEDSGDCRDSELMTFHGIDRCSPFLSEEALVSAHHLTPLQFFVLGGFKIQSTGVFFEALYQQQDELNRQIRNALSKGRYKKLADFSVAEFAPDGIKIRRKDIYEKQKATYDGLAEIVQSLPKLKDDSDAKDNLFRIIPGLMNFDQNAELKPDCSENLIFPARTQLRERVTPDFLEPMNSDISQIIFSDNPSRLLPLNSLVQVAFKLSGIYQRIIGFETDYPTLELFRSRAALANDYVSQLTTRVHTPETHQTIVLFMYYMLHDLDDIQSFSKIQEGEPMMSASWAKETRQKILQHFITYRMIRDLS